MSLIEKSERDWQAENDANTLARADEIKSDKSRLDRAAEAARKMQEEADARAKSLKRIAKKGGKRMSKKIGGVKLGEW